MPLHDHAVRGIVPAGAEADVAAGLVDRAAGRSSTGSFTGARARVVWQRIHRPSARHSASAPTSSGAGVSAAGSTALLAAANAGMAVFCIEESAGSVARSQPVMRAAASIAAPVSVRDRIVRFSR